LKQADRDAQKAGKMPMVCWKKNHQPWTAIVKDLPSLFEYQMQYREWSIISLTKLLSLADDFFLL